MDKFTPQNVTVSFGGIVLKPYASPFFCNTYINEDGETCAAVPRWVFNKIKYFTRNTGDKNTKYLLANDKEIKHLQSLGIQAKKNCDRFVIYAMS